MSRQQTDALHISTKVGVNFVQSEQNHIGSHCCWYTDRNSLMEALSVDQTCLILGGSCMCDTECMDK